MVIHRCRRCGREVIKMKNGGWFCPNCSPKLAKQQDIDEANKDEEIYEEPCPNGHGGLNPTGNFLRW